MHSLVHHHPPTSPVGVWTSNPRGMTFIGSTTARCHAVGPTRCILREGMAVLEAHRAFTSHEIMTPNSRQHSTDPTMILLEEN